MTVLATGHQDILKSICQWGFFSVFLLVALHWAGPWHQFGIIVFVEILLWLMLCLSVMSFVHLPKMFDVLGKYTLLAYIFHVSLLAILAASVRRCHFQPPVSYCILLALATCGTLAFLLFVQHMRNKSVFCDKTYKLIFS